MSYSDKVKDYIQTARRANTHTGKLIAFSQLMEQVFGMSSYENVPNVEQYVKTGVLMIMRGRLDMHLGQTIIEFKIDLARELEAGKEEIARYSAHITGKFSQVLVSILEPYGLLDSSWANSG